MLIAKLATTGCICACYLVYLFCQSREHRYSHKEFLCKSIETLIACVHGFQASKFVHGVHTHISCSLRCELFHSLRSEAACTHRLTCSFSVSCRSITTAVIYCIFYLHIGQEYPYTFHLLVSKLWLRDHLHLH